MTRWWIGCSGFHYKEWKEVFYPAGLAQRKWFDFYCEHFNTLELNVTFYRFPKLEFLKAWHDKSPRTFRFAVKAPRLITHYKRFNEVGSLLSDFYTTVQDGLQEKLGSILFQLHPGISYTEEKLNQIIDSLDPAFLNVIEFRHESWWNEDVYKKLKKNNITFCSISHPTLPDEVIPTSSTVYYRFHGVPDLYRSLYDKNFLKEIKDRIEEKASVKEAYIYLTMTLAPLQLPTQNSYRK